MSDEFADALKEAEKSPVLGPHYFTARKAAERFMEGFEAKQFVPLIESFAKQFQERLWEDLEVYLLGDTELNIQGEIYRGIDRSVEALLGGAPWALQRYALGERFDHDKIRAAVAKHIPQELQDQRIADLEAEVTSLKESLEWARR